ncbi:MAG: undecaprenyl-phosphate glucose phosphotransferase, partial [Thermodesulfovibrionia bacterium]|nr:undecaprenyl-phosphate glucose phosphotransferase [Thermodesulfovibrionia bacterium]
KKNSQFLESIFILLDVIIISAAWFVSHFYRFSEYSIIPYKVVPPLKIYMMLLFPIVLIFVFIFRNMGLYRPRRVATVFSEIFDVVKSVTLSVLILVSATYLIRKAEFSRLVFLYFWIISIVLLCIERLIVREILWSVRRKGYNIRRVLVVGADDLGVKAVKKIIDNSWTGLEVAGFLSDKKKIGEIVEGKKILGPTRKVKEIIRDYGIDQVFIALPVQSFKKMMYVVGSLRDEMVTVRIIPDIYQTITLNASLEDLDGLPVINLSDTSMYGWNVVVKRALDIIFSLAAIIAVLPLMLLIAIVIKITSAGPIFYRQERMGLDGKNFHMLKFRSMKVNAESQSGAVWAKENDPRRTFLGSFLRKTSLDELPQFFNVLKGDMSIVGPRPERPVFIKEFKEKIPKYMLRHKVKAGITGWAQVNGWRGNTSLEKRIECDIYYIENWSLWFDIKIMWLTLWKGLVNKHAY